MLFELVGKFAPAARILVLELHSRRPERVTFSGLGHAEFFRLCRRRQLQSRLAEHAIPSGIAYQETMRQLTQYFAAQGSSMLQAKQQAFAWIGQQVQMQSSLLAYVDVFWTLMLVSASAVPLALLLRKVKLGGPAHLGH